jgi:hypothetical protein
MQEGHKKKVIKNLGEKGENNKWKKGGESPNPTGHPRGQKNYKTLFREAIVKIAKLNKVKPDDIEVMIIQKGLTQALKGDFKFYKDNLDRLYGSPTQAVDLTSGGDKIVLTKFENYN